MSLRSLPEIKAFKRPAGFDWDSQPDALKRWAAAPMAADAGNDPSTISIFDVIGEDSWSGGGFTAKRMEAVLRSIGAVKPVTVAINSPGGDVFEGMTIFNLLRAHKGEVTVKVMGIAASAASIIAMAGDKIIMGVGSVLMIHNSWGLTLGNRHAHAESMDVLGLIDGEMAAVYAARSGQSLADVVAMMDGEKHAADGTYMSAATAVEKGFADAVADLPAPSASLRADIAARRRLDAKLAGHHMPRHEREAMLRDLDGARAAAPATPELTAAMLSLLTTLRN
jgi:ATP-dependent Clp protease, protease subunit